MSNLIIEKNIIDEISSVQVSQARKELLKPLINYLQERKNQKESIQFNFICTHNSRRSVLAQVWAQTLAHYFKIENFSAFSGGTESTAVYQTIIKTLEKQGFDITKRTDSDNPEYEIVFSDKEVGLLAFSKKFDHVINPSGNCIAIMVCDHANETCPYISGVEQRISLTYDDPKTFDGSPNKDSKYLERSIEIASELYFVFSQLK